MLRSLQGSPLPICSTLLLVMRAPDLLAQNQEKNLLGKVWACKACKLELGSECMCPENSMTLLDAVQQAAAGSSLRMQQLCKGSPFQQWGTLLAARQASVLPFRCPALAQMHVCYDLLRLHMAWYPVFVPCTFAAFSGVAVQRRNLKSTYGVYALQASIGV